MTILKNFWVFEGLDGAGTTTELNIISNYLMENGRAYISTCEPTDNEIGKLIRKILSGETIATQSTISKLFSADRDDHLTNPIYGIYKHLNDGKIVLSDRYLFSSLAYQSVNFDYEAVYELNKNFPLPEVTFFLDVPLDVCLKRITDRNKKFEIYERKDYLKSVIENYKKCINAFKENCNIIIINGNESIKSVSENILEVINELLSKN